ncbi:hypothetical protein SAMN05661096_02424 [Marivirga sericea]|uniref:Uncharacterized protein n=1 Tax=Marivirga sericea TaxID=1028 RepID=A0A1X7K5G9_9BACT|nr:hypothetical protein [Marivirga sericea]SMG36282.1 hypothetical protein SAMN05661096_02424 [Marivirga sericea]
MKRIETFSIFTLFMTSFIILSCSKEPESLKDRLQQNEAIVIEEELMKVADEVVSEKTNSNDLEVIVEEIIESTAEGVVVKATGDSSQETEIITAVVVEEERETISEDRIEIIVEEAIVD